MSSTNIDYIAIYFELRTLTRIHGEPNCESLKTLKTEIKTNATQVKSDLGGGQHRNLGLVLTPAEYAAVSIVSYNRPLHQGNLTIPAGTAQHKAKRLREEHKEAIRLFRQTIDMEKSLIKQAVTAIEPEYLKALCDPVSNAITDRNV